MQSKYQENAFHFERETANAKHICGIKETLKKATSVILINVRGAPIYIMI